MGAECSLRTGCRGGRIRIEYVNRIVYRIGSFKPINYPHTRLISGDGAVFFAELSNEEKRRKRPNIFSHKEHLKG